MILTKKQAQKLGHKNTIDLKAIYAKEYLDSKKTKMDNFKETWIKIVAWVGIFYYILTLLFGWGMFIPNEANANNTGENLAFLNRFPEHTSVIGCYNDYTKKVREGTKCTQKGDKNVSLPPRSQIKVWLKYYNEFEIINRLAIVNFESNFNENAQNSHAIWYVQTLRSHGVAPDIDSQLKWMSNRQASQKVKYTAWGSKRCGYYWENDNVKDGFEAWEYGVLSCLYRYHYHAYKGTWYAKRGIEATQYYKRYMFGYKYDF